jgi:hypothetical protein
MGRNIQGTSMGYNDRDNIQFNLCACQQASQAHREDGDLWFVCNERLGEQGEVSPKCRRDGVN